MLNWRSDKNHPAKIVLQLQCVQKLCVLDFSHYLKCCNLKVIIIIIIIIIIKCKCYRKYLQTCDTKELRKEENHFAHAQENKHQSRFF